jgi:flagellar motility protein MotE (MotC chaperone)
MKRWVLAIVFLIIAVFLAAGMLHSTGVIDLEPILMQRIEAIPALAPHLEIYRTGQVAENKIEEFEAEIEVEKGKLIQKQLALDTRAEALAAKENQLAKSLKELEQERKELLNLKEEIEAVRAGLLELERLRSIYSEMKGKDAAAIMGQLRPEMIAFILAEMDPEVAGNILTNLDPKLAAEITRMALTDKK